MDEGVEPYFEAIEYRGQFFNYRGGVAVRGVEMLFNSADEVRLRLEQFNALQGKHQGIKFFGHRIQVAMQPGNFQAKSSCDEEKDKGDAHENRSGNKIEKVGDQEGDGYRR